ERARLRGVEVLLPMDHVVAEEFSDTATPQIVSTQSIPDGVMALDIGPVTRARFSEVVQKAKTVFWNGPMGVFEMPAYAAGTMAGRGAMAKASGYTGVGGGDSVAAAEEGGVIEKLSHVSTGGGASLGFLEQGSLPGVDVLVEPKTGES